MRIACVGYRGWALNIYEKLQNKFPDYKFLMQLSKNDYSEILLMQFKPDLILFYGWSDIIASRLIKSCKCLMLHPSPLPKYRGGSPIQNQIINGDIHSAVTIFLMDEGIDTGPVTRQKYLSLEGTLDEIFKRIEFIGFDLTRDIFFRGLNVKDQDSEAATYCLRRTPEQSEITVEELETHTAEYLYNKIRMLQDPYPNPFIKTIDGKKLIIKSSQIIDAN
jgi:methionyl-tRNA formyltransferase